MRLQLRKRIVETKGNRLHRPYLKELELARTEKDHQEADALLMGINSSMQTLTDKNTRKSAELRFTCFQ